MSTRSRKKVESKPRIKEEKKNVNGKESGPLTFRLDSCLNCETPLGNGTTKVAEFMLSFSETSKRTFSVLEALTSIFEISDTNSKFFPMLTSKNLVMCPGCATVLANLYKSYVELMQLSKTSANICKLVAKAEKWHEGKREFLTTNPTQSSEDDDDDDEDDSDSEGEPNSRLIKTERDSDDEGGDEDEEDMEYITPNGTLTKSQARNKPGRKGRKKRRASKTKNGDFDYDEGSDEDYREPKSKSRKASSSKAASSGGGGCVDRSRIRERITLALDGTPRKRIRRRPSQTREDDYKCLECDRVFKFECRLIKHMKTHMDKQRTQCHVCEQTFLYSWMLENHVLAEHEMVKPKICGVCDLTFYRTEIFDNHFCTPKDQQSTERAEKPHWCQLCGKAFQKLAHLTLHLRSHEDEKPLTCTKCSQRFKYEKCLMKHMVVHDTEHVCPLCQKVFPLKSKLNAHMQSHDVEKTYPCPAPDCDKVFKQATALQRHMKSHSGEKTAESPPESGTAGTERFGCDTCLKSFTRKSDLSRHLRNQVCTRRSNIKTEHDEDDEKGGSSDDEGWEQQGGDGGGHGSDGDSMSPGVSNSDNENALPSSPSAPPSPQLNLSEEDSNPAPAPKTEVGIVLASKSAPVEPEDSFLSDKDSN